LRGLLRFVRATEREVGMVNLNDVVRGALDLVSYRFGVDEIAVGGRLDPALPAVQGDAIKLEQVLVNLLSNAIEPLRGSGRPPPRFPNRPSLRRRRRPAPARAARGERRPAPRRSRISAS